MYWRPPPCWPPGGWSKRALRPSRCAQRPAEAVAQAYGRDAAPRLVGDGRPGLVDEAVAVRIDAGASGAVPPLEHAGLGSRAGARRLAPVEHALERRPEPGAAHVLGRRRIRRVENLGQGQLPVADELAEQQVGALDRVLVPALVAGPEVLRRLCPS